MHSSAPPPRVSAQEAAAAHQVTHRASLQACPRTGLGRLALLALRGAPSLVSSAPIPSFSPTQTQPPAGSCCMGPTPNPVLRSAWLPSLGSNPTWGAAQAPPLDLGTLPFLCLQESAPGPPSGKPPLVESPWTALTPRALRTFCSHPFPPGHGNASPPGAGSPPSPTSGTVGAEHGGLQVTHLWHCVGPWCPLPVEAVAPLSGSLLSLGLEEGF